MKEATYQPVPVEAARDIAREYRKDAVLVVALDRAFGQTHCTTYGRTPMDKVEAAGLGGRFVEFLGCNPAEGVSHEDFRHVPAAGRAAENERLRSALEALLARAELLNLSAADDPPPFGPGLILAARRALAGDDAVDADINPEGPRR